MPLGSARTRGAVTRCAGAPLVLVLIQYIGGAAALHAPSGLAAQATQRQGLPLAARLAQAQLAGGAVRTMVRMPAPPTVDAASLFVGDLTLRLRGGKKGTGSMGKKGTGHKAHPSYKYNLSYPRISKHSESKRKRYCLRKNPERSGRCKHLRLVNRRFKHGFRTSPPYAGPGTCV